MNTRILHVVFVIYERSQQRFIANICSVHSSEYEETESEDENDEPRLKPVFVSKKDRATIAEKEKEALKQKQLDAEAKRVAKERRRQTLRLVEESVKKDLEKAKVSALSTQFSFIHLMHFALRVSEMNFICFLPFFSRIQTKLT